MEEYTEVFHRAGYSKEEDVGNLKELSERDLNRMGVVKMGKLCIRIQVLHVQKHIRVCQNSTSHFAWVVFIC